MPVRFTMLLALLMAGCIAEPRNSTAKSISPPEHESASDKEDLTWVPGRGTVIIGRIISRTTPVLGMCGYWSHATYEVEKILKGRLNTNTITVAHLLGGPEGARNPRVGSRYKITLDYCDESWPQPIAGGTFEPIN